MMMYRGLERLCSSIWLYGDNGNDSFSAMSGGVIANLIDVSAEVSCWQPQH